MRGRTGAQKCELMLSAIEYVVILYLISFVLHCIYYVWSFVLLHVYYCLLWLFLFLMATVCKFHLCWYNKVYLGSSIMSYIFTATEETQSVAGDCVVYFKAPERLTKWTLS